MADLDPKLCRELAEECLRHVADVLNDRPIAPSLTAIAAQLTAAADLAEQNAHLTGDNERMAGRLARMSVELEQVKREYSQTIGDRTAALRPLDAERVRQVVIEAFSYVDCLAGHPDAPRVAARVAEKLAGLVAPLSAEELRDRIVALREEWRPHADREWPGENFVEDLDRLLTGIPQP